MSIKLFDRRPRGPLNEYFNAINTEFCFKIDNRMKVSKELAGQDLLLCVCGQKIFFLCVWTKEFSDKNYDGRSLAVWANGQKVSTRS